MTHAVFLCYESEEHLIVQHKKAGSKYHLTVVKISKRGVNITLFKELFHDITYVNCKKQSNTVFKLWQENSG